MTSIHAPAPFDERTRRIGIAAAIGAISAVGTSLSLGLPLLAIVLESRGVSASAIGLNTAVAGVAALLVTPLVPALVRRFGAAVLLAAAVVVATVTFPLFHVFESYWAWFPLRLVFHGSINTAFIVSEFWINALAPPHRRGLVMGSFATVLALGFAVGPVILGAVGTEGALPFLAGTVVLAISAIPVLLALGASPPTEGGTRRSFLGTLTLVPLATFAALAMGATESGVMSFIAIYGLRIGFDETKAALLVSAFAIGNVAMQIPLGMISDRMDRRALLFLIAAAGAAIAAVLPLVAHLETALFAVLAVWGGLVAGLYTVGLTHLGARLSGADLAAANAAFIFMYAVGMLIGPAAMGAGMDGWRPHGLTAVATVILGAYAAFAAGRILLVPRKPVAETSAS